MILSYDLSPKWKEIGFVKNQKGPSGRLNQFIVLIPTSLDL